MASQNLSDMEIFASIAKHGGIRKASETLDFTRSTLSRRLSQIEERLGIRLINRNSRQFQISEAGKLYLAYCIQAVELTKQADWSISTFRDQPTGTLRITAPMNYGAKILQPVVNNFLKAHPQIDIEVMLSDAFLDVIETGIDIAIRLGPLADSEMHARLIHTEKKRLCCSKAYALEHGTPKNPYQLEDHWCIRYARGKDEIWKFNNEEDINIKPEGRLIVNDIEAMREAVLGDMGITFLPRFLCQKEIDKGEVLSLLEDWIEPNLPMYAVYPKRNLVPKKVTSFINFLQDSLI